MKTVSCYNIKKEIGKTCGRNELLLFAFHTFLYSIHYNRGTMLRGERAHALIYDGFRLRVNIMSMTYSWNYKIRLGRIIFFNYTANI